MLGEGSFYWYFSYTCNVNRNPLLHSQDDIGVGSLVEVATDVDQHHYGVVRWIGIIDGMKQSYI